MIDEFGDDFHEEKIFSGRFMPRAGGKGQLISKCPFSVIVSTKIPTKLF